MTLFFLFLIVLVTTTVQGCCPDGWIRHSDSCYMFVATKATWLRAAQICAERGAVLVAIESGAENTFIRDYLRMFAGLGANIPTWIGGTDAQVEGVWRWSPSGNRLTYVDWDLSEPAGCPTCGDCLVIWPGYNYHWGDYPCYHEESFMCERRIPNGNIIG
ncbi:perlucin-like [Haliotis cracherodii]|uniref:perlucin-like n=1 Tax=Haliotis cracherodii TaxID=6455 RepID=UPI0039E9DB10